MTKLYILILINTSNRYLNHYRQRLSEYKKFKLDDSIIKCVENLIEKEKEHISYLESMLEKTK